MSKSETNKSKTNSPDAGIPIVTTKERKEALKKVSTSGFYLEEMPDAIKNDKQVVLAAVSNNGRSIEFASDEMKADKEVGLTAVKQNGGALMHLSIELRDDKDVVSAAVVSFQNGTNDAYLSASDRLKNDKDVVMASASFAGESTLAHTSALLRNDKDVILVAVRQSGMALGTILKKMREDKDVAFEAVKQNPNSLKFVSSKLTNDKSFALAIVRENGLALIRLPSSYLDDRDVVLAAVSQCGAAIVFASDNLRVDKEIISAALVQDPESQKYICKTVGENTPKRIENPSNKLFLKVLRYVEEDDGIDLSETADRVRSIVENTFGESVIKVERATTPDNPEEHLIEIGIDLESSLEDLDMEFMEISSLLSAYWGVIDFTNSKYQSYEDGEYGTGCFECDESYQYNDFVVRVKDEVKFSPEFYQWLK